MASQVKWAVEELIHLAKMRAGQILVVGCSTSEVRGSTIGTSGSQEIAQAIIRPLLEATYHNQIYLAVQCCEHLNRALVVERALLQTYPFLEEVAVRPIAAAGGALAAQAIEHYADPTVIETIQAHAALDIGETLIGMHLKAVAVPVRLSIRQIGNARLTAARTRPKLIGGHRACYD
ncbi:TIGR01440 family protein [Heliorestis acidaminivorans]|uniref:UPF0340 protein F9B85_04150 n=1 Tax=Heliorestis acidaminivorans TaxID=553427 RepID=A0A6I0EUS2_9FIRM|nr:TIGR01440 family protein [Heliorestis acidaminivorans]